MTVSVTIEAFPGVLHKAHAYLMEKSALGAGKSLVDSGGAIANLPDFLFWNTVCAPIKTMQVPHDES